VEKDRGYTWNKNQEKKFSRFFWQFFFELSVFTALTVSYHYCTVGSVYKNVSPIFLACLNMNMNLTFMYKNFMKKKKNIFKHYSRPHDSHKAGAVLLVYVHTKSKNKIKIGFKSSCFFTGM
jgi:hypothetical protein